MSDCRKIQDAIQERMDAPVAADLRQAIEAHLRLCGECRSYQEGLDAVRRALVSLPEVPFPDEALALVWERTIRSRPDERHRPSMRFDWRVALAAAAAVTLLFLPALFRPVLDPYSAAELARADRDARRVLSLASQTLRRTERAAVNQVLAGEIVPAVRRIPIRWPQSKRPDSRRPRT